MDAHEQLGRLRGIGAGEPFRQRIARSLKGPLAARKIDILQLNVGKRCNLACRHCHVEAGPGREEAMPREVFEACLEIARAAEVSTIDVTGGSPEMNPHLEWFLGAAGSLGKRLIVRSNAVILLDRSFSRFIDIFARHRVEIVISLPDYNEARTDRQRGPGAFRRIIQAMRLLNDRGYGTGTGLDLDLVHNPAGAFLPGPQDALEREYERRLRDDFGVVFTRLFCIINVPIGRYLAYLLATGNLEEYMTGICGAFNPSAVDRVMCRTTLSVGWDGTLYDCDFNQALGLPVGFGAPRTIARFDIDRLRTREIVIDDHCYGCTAGAGSSCQGATAASPGK